MTPEERAQKLAVMFVADHYGRGGDGNNIMSEGSYRHFILDAIRAAVEEEREACAKLAAKAFEDERCWENYKDGGDVIEAAIRARGQVQPDHVLEAP